MSDKDRFLLLSIECGEDTCKKEPEKMCGFMKAGLHCAYCRLFDIELPLEFGTASCDVKRVA